MASTKSYLEFILDQLSGLDSVSHRAMMGEYILYVDGKVIGGIYDDRLLLKPTAAAERMIPDAPPALPYEGARSMLLVEQVDDRAFLQELLRLTARELPAPKKRKSAI